MVKKYDYQKGLALVLSALLVSGSSMMTLPSKVYAQESIVTGAATENEVTNEESSEYVNPFKDVADDAWYAKSVQYAVQSGLFTGTSEDTFTPNGQMTRGMLVTVLYRAAGRPAVEYGKTYPDVESGAYYEKAVAWASSIGMATGYADGNFRPNDPVTREQVAKILYQYARYSGEDVTARTDITGYNDYSKISSWAIKYMEWTAAEGVLTGSSNKLNPKGNATRAEIASILRRYMESRPDAEEPGTEESSTEEPGTEESSTEEPGTEESSTEEPGTEESSTEEPGTEESSTEEPGTEDAGTESEYTYSLYTLNQYDIYSDENVILVLKTDNTDIDTINTDYGTSDVSVVMGYLYDDVKYYDSTTRTSSWKAIQSQTGYIRVIQFDNPGTYTIEITERIDDTRVTVADLTITVKDGTAAEDAWYESVIASETNDSMTVKEKMDALYTYVRKNFKYQANDGTYLVFLTTNVGPWWETKQIDCWGATSIMCEFARRLGLESEWTYSGYLNHYYATVYIDEVGYEYDASPYSTSNIVTEWDYVLE